MSCFRTRGKQGDQHSDPDDPPRRRTNQHRGHGTEANDRPPVIGTVGRTRGQVRLRVGQQTKGQPLRPHVHTLTQTGATVKTDERKGYRRLQRLHVTVAHGQNEWARAEDGDGIREVQVNTIEGWWTSARNFLRPFRGVQKQYLSRYIARCEVCINLKRVTPQFVLALAALH